MYKQPPFRNALAGHGVSSDLVHWKRMNDSGVCGSTSGGVALGSELREKAGWDAVSTNKAL